MPEIEEKPLLQKTAKDGEALQVMRAHPGWPVLIGILKDIFNEYFDILQEKDDPAARAGIRNIKEIAFRIDNRISLGEDAKQQLKHQIFNQEGTGPAAP